MARGVPSATSNRRNSQRARREWERWEREHYIIYNQEGNEEFVPADDEIFVSLFHYKEDKNLKKHPNAVPVKGKIDPRYKVSNKGNVISLTFHDIDRPYLMSQSEKLNDRDEPYMVVGTGWSVHSLVWFSFAADAIKNGYEFPKSYGIPVEEIRTLKRLTKLTGENTKRKNSEGDYWIEIHHKDLNTRNNSLDNLECDNHDIHVLLHELNDMESEEERMKTIVKYPFAVPTMIELEGTLSISEIDTNEFLSALSAEDRELINWDYWKQAINSIMDSVTPILKMKYFEVDRCLGIQVKNTVAFFLITHEGKGLKIEWLSQEGHNILVNEQNKDLDIYCKDGTIYLMNYTNDEEITEDD